MDGFAASDGDGMTTAAYIAAYVLMSAFLVALARYRGSKTAAFVALAVVAVVWYAQAQGEVDPLLSREFEQETSFSEQVPKHVDVSEPNTVTASKVTIAKRGSDVKARKAYEQHAPLQPLVMPSTHGEYDDRVWYAQYHYCAAVMQYGSLRDVMDPSYTTRGSDDRENCVDIKNSGEVCLPDVYMLAPQKSGTTDTFDRLELVPQLSFGTTKEHHYWTKTLGPGPGAHHEAAELIHWAYNAYMRDINSWDKNVNVKDINLTKPLLLDASASTLYGHDDYMGSCRIPELMFFAQPKARFIVLLRDPVPRAFSDFKFYLDMVQRKKKKKKKQWAKTNVFDDFDESIVRQIEAIQACYNRNIQQTDTGVQYGMEIGPDLSLIPSPIWEPIDECMYETKLGNLYGKESIDADLLGRVLIGMYQPYLKVYFHYFSAEQIFVSNVQLPPQELFLALLKWLGVQGDHPVLTEDIVTTEHHHEHNAKDAKAAMSPETQTILQRFYEPWNEKLVTMIKHEYHSVKEKAGAQHLIIPSDDMKTFWPY